MNMLVDQWERCFSPLGVEMIDQLWTLEVFVSTCPVDYAKSVPKETVHYSMNLEVCWVNLCNITASSVMFLTNRTGNTMNVNF